MKSVILQLNPKYDHMRTKFTLILLVCVLVGCAKNADIESVNVPVEPAFQTVLPKISKDISTLSADDAIKVANLFSHGNVLTKSETLKDVRNETKSSIICTLFLWDNLRLKN